MADEPQPSDQDKLQTEGRKDNAAQPLNQAKPNAGAERYPSVDRTDSIKGGEGRSFEPKVRNETAPPLGDDVDDPVSLPGRSPNEGRFGPAGDPAEGKR